MSNKPLFRFIIFIFSLAVLATCMYYVYQSGRIYYKAIQFEQTNKQNLSIIAHQAVLNNYPYSPVASLSRVYLYKHPEALIELNSINNYKKWNPIFIDYYVFTGLLLILGLTILGWLQRITGSKGLNNKQLARRFIFLAVLVSTFIGYISYYINNSYSFNWNKEIFKIGSCYYYENPFYMITTLFFGIVFLYNIVAIIKFIFAFRKQ